MSVIEPITGAELFDVGERASDAVGSVQLDTTARSLPHVLLGPTPVRSDVSHMAVARICAGSVFLTYGVLLVVSMLGVPSLTVPQGSIRLPFLQDWNAMFMYLVSFPTIVGLLALDQTALSHALSRVQREQIVIVSVSDGQQLQARWERRFQRINIVGQAVGCLFGLVVATANYWAFTPPAVGFWIALDGRMLPSGWYFLACLWLFYAALSFYIIRTAFISFFLASLVHEGHIRMLPFHPDKCGGLRPVGRLGLRNQYGLTVCGINLVLFLLMSRTYQVLPPIQLLIIVTVCGYIVIGPLVFVAPLLPFRAGMLRTKSDLLGEVAARLRLELQRVRQEIPSGPITKQDEELIDRLRKIGAVIDELPVWPFDAGTLRRFLTAYVIPIVGAVAFPIAKSMLEGLLKSFK